VEKRKPSLDMEKEADQGHSHERWAHFRFSVIGPLLAAPPARGELQARLQELATKKWRHPLSGEWFVAGFSTIERWYYKARRSKAGTVEVLKRKIRSDHGQHPAFTPQADRSAQDPAYVSVPRFMKSHGLFKRRRRGPVHSPGAQAAEQRFEAREVRSYEAEYVNGLWHLDFRHGSLRVLRSNGQWAYPILLGVLDDRSRLCCHAQWYVAEVAEELCHGLSQAFQKRGLPRSMLFDNGSAMVSKETEQGLTRLSILFENTLPYSPFQNGKQEVFWTQIEGRLLPMFEGMADLGLDQLNETTLAWLELEYNRKVHSEIGQTPLHRFLNNKDVGRPSPSARDLQLAFTAGVDRSQRRSDGTISLDGIR
jgi:transposase InsO family protein